jgi:periplasmic protein TonB
MMTEAIPADAVPVKKEKATPRERRRFTEAVALSALGHVLAILAVIVLWHPEPMPVPLPPIPVKVVTTIGATGASGAGHDVAAPAAATGSAASAAAAPAPDQPAAPPVPTTPPPPAPPLKAASAPPPPTTPKAVPLPAPQTVTASIEPVPPEKPAPPQPPAPTRAETAAVTATPLQPPPTPKQAHPAPAPSPDATAAASAAPANLASNGAGGQGRSDHGAGRVEAGNGALDGPSDDYLEKVRLWVARFRVYPEEAKKKREEGMVSLGFKFARDGTVLDAWIEKSSGFPMLDQAALKMIHDASPIPKVPDQYKGDTLTLVMPENYRIGLFDRLFN